MAGTLTRYACGLTSKLALKQCDVDAAAEFAKVASRVQHISCMSGRYTAHAARWWAGGGHWSWVSGWWGLAVH